MKRSDNLCWSQLKVGILVLVGLALIVAGIVLLGEKTKLFVGKGRLAVVLADAGGLKVGAPVWLAGIDVGIVRRIRFEDPKRTNRVEIDMEISHDALNKIGSDSQVSVKTRGLLGEKYVDITPSAEIWDQVPERIEGRSVVKLEEVMLKSSQAFDKLNIILDRINRGEGTIGQLATKDDPYEKLVDIMGRLDRTLAGIESSRGTLNRLIYDDHLYEKMVALANSSGLAADELRELNRKLLSGESSIGMLMADREFYDKGMAAMARADNSLRSLEEVVGRLERGEGTAGKLLNDRELYDRLNRTSEDLDLLLKDIRQNPRRYIKFSLF